MEFFSHMVSLQLMLFLLIIAGVLIKKAGLISEEGQKTLSDLLLNAILPCNIVHSFMGGLKISQEFVINCLLMLLFSIGIQMVCVLGSKVLFTKFPHEQKSVLSYGLICSNSGFIGLPIAEAIFGSISVTYTSIFQIPLRFSMWTAGLSLFTTVSRKDALKKLATHPCIIAVFLGLLLMLVPIPVPAVLDNTITAISKCTTPISMFVIGAILADVPIRSLFRLPVLYYAFLRLLAVPLLVYAALLPFSIDPLLVNICVLMAGCPAGCTVPILADKYHCDAAFASQITFTSTLLSIVTLPLLTLLM